jgi:cytochrome c biogenesis protein CcdA
MSTPEQPSGKAIAALVLGILGFLQLAPCIGPIAAIVLGWGEKGGVGRAGLILGWITLAMYAFAAGVLLLLLLLGGVAALPFMNS